MQAFINISPQILDWVMANMQNDVVSTSVSQCIETWKAGTKRPTFNQVEKVSRATGIPLGYFFLQTPPKEDLSLLEYRTVDSVNIQNPSRNLVDTIHDMERTQDWMHDFLLSENYPVLQFVGCQRDVDDINVLAENIRKALGLTDKWFEKSPNAEASFKYIRSLISNLGVLVMMNGIVGSNTHRVLDINEFRAFTLIDKYAPLIFINSTDATNGRLFSLLHEFSHIWLGVNNFFNDRYSTEIKVAKIERICNAVAAEILVPQQVFLKKWSNQKADTINEKVADLSKYFKCGCTVIARKALDNGFITYPQYQKISQTAVALSNEIRSKKKEQESGGNFYDTAASRIDHRFFKALLGSLQEGRTLYSDAFKLTNTGRNTFLNLTEKIRGEEK